MVPNHAKATKMNISVKTPIPFPIQKVYEAMRDHMPELAAFMPNIESIEVKKREIKEDGLFLVNQWNPKATEIPSVARPLLIKTKHIGWIMQHGKTTSNIALGISKWDLWQIEWNAKEQPLLSLSMKTPQKW